MKAKRRVIGIAVVATLCLTLGAALAQPGPPGSGGGPSYGPGYGFGPNNTPGWSVMTEQERIDHRNRMHSFKSYDECRVYMNDFAKQMQQRAKEKGTTIGRPNEVACDRMRERGFFK